MAVILLVGLDGPTLEGIAQTLGAVGHTPLLAQRVDEAAVVAALCWAHRRSS